MSESWTTQRARLQQAAQLSDKSAILMTKDNWFCKMLGAILTVVTFGGIGYTRFMERFATTIGPIQFYPKGWPPSSVEAVCTHEGVHSRQAVVCGIITWLALSVLTSILCGYHLVWWAGLIDGGLSLVCTLPMLWWRPVRICTAFLGLPLMFLVYILLPIPLGFAYFRYRMELAADKAKWRYMLEHGATAGAVRIRAKGFAATISSGAYGWSVPESMALKGFDKAAMAVILKYKEEHANA